MKSVSPPLFPTHSPPFSPHQQSLLTISHVSEQGILCTFRCVCLCIHTHIHIFKQVVVYYTLFCTLLFSPSNLFGDPSVFSIKIIVSLFLIAVQYSIVHVAVTLGLFFFSAEILERKLWKAYLYNHLGWAFLRIQGWAWAGIIQALPLNMVLQVLTCSCSLLQVLGNCGRNKIDPAHFPA